MPSLIPAANNTYHPSHSNVKLEEHMGTEVSSLEMYLLKNSVRFAQSSFSRGGDTDDRRRDITDDDAPMWEPTLPKRAASPTLDDQPYAKRRCGEDEDEPSAVLSDEDPCFWHNADVRYDGVLSGSPPDLFGKDMKGITQHDKENACAHSDTPDVSALYPLAAFRKTISVPAPSSPHPRGATALRDTSNTSTSSNPRGGSITIESVVTTPPRPLTIAINRLLSRTLRALQPTVRTPLRQERSLPRVMPTQDPEDAPRIQHPTPPAISEYSALGLAFPEFPSASPGLVADIALARVESSARDAHAHQGRLDFPGAPLQVPAYAVTAREETAGALTGVGVGGLDRAAIAVLQGRFASLEKDYRKLADELRRERATRIFVEVQARRMLSALVKVRDRRGSSRTIKRTIKEALKMVRTAQVLSPRNRAHPTSHCAPAAPSAPQH
ncbi:hypothetical protein FOMPIDRAFT_82710 [Fomitopsis schrenkii]|uniref:Uncharacterized protein n=1 Tax=Fomitopsis schrenkii TaxID=2126942 RepID=S8DQK6_FOMSC|nr:hypothetical protein FOMPIDRAFT_82710 [Fomitopsis schrenkii]